MRALLNQIRKRMMTLWLWQALFVAAVAWGFFSSHLSEESAMGKIRFVAMDSRDTFYLSNLGNFETAQHLRTEIAKMAVETMFSRSPDGFDNPERLERLFNPAPAEKLNKDANRDSDVFKSQQIHQKVETGQIREVSIDSNTALMSVEGQILRIGMFNQRITNDTKKVTVFLRLKLNDSMATNGNYPLVVANYETRFE